jgi:hypothetical protein
VQDCSARSPVCMTSMLVVISLEDGVTVASKLAQSFPVGQLATLSFVILFGQLCPSVGVTAALLLGYLAALLTLGTIEWISRIKPVIHRKEVCLAA